ncbi:MAG: RluA family pseudouridine synthase [Gammaproteobacteria bacterium]
MNTPAVKIKPLIVSEDHASQRIDNFLIRELKKVPRELIYKLLRKKAIRVNEKKVKPEYRVQPGDVISLPSTLVISAPKAETIAGIHGPSAQAIQTLEKNILHEDANLIILNKPAGFASHGGSGISFGVIETMRHARPKLKNLELVHRLDRDTSGCLILAKKRSILKELHELLRQNKIKKTYTVLLKGKWRGKTQKVSAALRKNQLQSGERMVMIDPNGKVAHTTFSPKQIFPQASLMEVDLGTGRTHQIRVHAAYVNYPIAGDTKYGDKAFNAFMEKKGLRRLFLHATELNFYLPSTEKNFTVSAPLPEELKRTLDALKL